MSDQPPESPEHRRWWNTLLSRLFKREKRPGDVISARIGDDARGVVVGKNIIQIGTLVVPTLPVLVFPVLLALLAALAVGLRSLGPARMSGSFNLAVAEFGEMDPRGEVRRSQRGRLLSQRLFEGLQIEFESLPAEVSKDFRWQIWHDSLDLSQKRVKIGIVRGDGPDDREREACLLAGRINAHIVVYGSLPAPGVSDPFQPEFAICDNPGLRLDSQEITGGHRPGSGIPLQILERMGEVSADLSINIALNAWTKSLASFAIGILYDLQGRPNLALDVFEQARAALDSEYSPGTEVLWFFIGREHLFLENLGEAQAAFEQALQVNPGYARAYIGLGGVYYLRTLELSPAGRLASPDMDRTIQAYRQAISTAPESPGALIEEKSQIALAGAYLLQGEAYREQADLPAARASFAAAEEAVVPVLQKLEEERQYRLLAQAHQTLGAAYHQQGHLLLLQGEKGESQPFFEQAVHQYEQCILQKDAAFEDIILRQKIVDALCIPYRQAALTALTEIKGGTQ